MASPDLRRLSSLLDEALDLPEGERLAWLEARTDLSTDLRSRLRRLLDDGAQGITLPPLPAYRDGELGEDAADDPDLVAEGSVGPYRLIREIGRGGMGAVWLAERADGALKRQVALKLPHSALPRAQLAERFARERDILAGLEHPHIARLYDAGVTTAGRSYLALEYVEGQNLLDYGKQRKLDLPARLKLFLQVLRAIQYAHSRLVIHRDLKPGNILVTDEGYVRLLDFGIAKLMAEGEAGQTRLTEVGGRMLTPQYAAPEQILGLPIGTEADIYALGVVLHELLTGSLPYRIKRDTRGALEDAIVEGDTRLASEAAAEDAQAKTWAKKLRGDLNTIVLKALKKDPKERYATAAAFADDIQRYLQGEPVLAQRDSAGYRARKFLRRYRWAVAATAVVVLALSAGLGAALWQASEAERQAEIARTEARTAQAVKDFLQGIFLANSAQQADPVKARQTTARELLDIGAAKLEESLADVPEALGELLWTFSELYSQLLLPDRATALAERRLELIRKTKGAQSIELGEALFMVFATARSAWIDDPRQERLLDESMDIFNRHPTKPEYRRTALALSAEYRADRDFARALREAREAMGIKADALTDADAPPMRTAAIELLAGEPLRARDAALQGLAAEAALEAARAEGKTAPGDGGMLQRPAILSLLADAHWALAQRDEAVAQGRKALAAAQHLFGDSDPDTARFQARLSSYLRAPEGAPEADILLDAAAATLAGGRPDDRSRLRFNALGALGRAQADAGRFGEAAATLARALALRDPALDASPAIAEVLRDLARAYLGAGRSAEAATTLARAVAMREKAGIAPADVLQEEAALRERLTSGK